MRLRQQPALHLASNGEIGVKWLTVGDRRAEVLADDRQKMPVIPRLGNKIASPAMHGLHRQFNRAPTRHGDHGYIAALSTQTV